MLFQTPAGLAVGLDHESDLDPTGSFAPWQDSRPAMLGPPLHGSGRELGYTTAKRPGRERWRVNATTRESLQTTVKNGLKRSVATAPFSFWCLSTHMARRNTSGEPSDPIKQSISGRDVSSAGTRAGQCKSPTTRFPAVDTKASRQRSEFRPFAPREAQARLPSGRPARRLQSL